MEMDDKIVRGDHQGWQSPDTWKASRAGVILVAPEGSLSLILVESYVLAVGGKHRLVVESDAIALGSRESNDSELIAIVLMGVGTFYGTFCWIAQAFRLLVNK